MTNLSSNEKGEKIMQDFNEFSSSIVGNETPPDLLNLVKNLSKKFDGKSQNDLLKAIYAEAVKGKQNGTLTNEQIENFKVMLYPFLDDKKRKYLDKVVEEIKRI